MLWMAHEFRVILSVMVKSLRSEVEIRLHVCR
jgi:hypothetical protein